MSLIILAIMEVESGFAIQIRTIVQLTILPDVQQRGRYISKLVDNDLNAFSFPRQFSSGLPRWTLCAASTRATSWIRGRSSRDRESDRMSGARNACRLPACVGVSPVRIDLLCMSPVLTMNYPGPSPVCRWSTSRMASTPDAATCSAPGGLGSVHRSHSGDVHVAGGGKCSGPAAHPGPPARAPCAARHSFADALSDRRRSALWRNSRSCHSSVVAQPSPFPRCHSRNHTRAGEYWCARISPARSAGPLVMCSSGPESCGQFEQRFPQAVRQVVAVEKGSNQLLAAMPGGIG